MLTISRPDGWIEVPCTNECGNMVPIPKDEPNRYYADPITCMKCQDAKAEPRLAIYSGPDRKGICICGHKWDDHHLGVVLRIGANKVNSESENPLL